MEAELFCNEKLVEFVLGRLFPWTVGYGSTVEPEITEVGALEEGFGAVQADQAYFLQGIRDAKIS